MFFLIRCVFWLTIVFHAMSWPPESWTESWPPETLSIPAWSLIQPPRTADTRSGMKMASDAAANLTAAAGTAVAAKLEQGCLNAPAECLALAARLPQIVATSQSNQQIANQPPASHPGASQAIASRTIDVLPPKRPIHLAESDEPGSSLARKLPIQHN
jgi:hypothetical protein